MPKPGGVTSGWMARPRRTLLGSVDPSAGISARSGSLSPSLYAQFSQRVFAEKERYTFPVLSDFWPHGAVAKAYHVFDEKKGCALRGSFVIDKAGVVQFALDNGMDARNHEDYKTALASL